VLTATLLIGHKTLYKFSSRQHIFNWTRSEQLRPQPGHTGRYGVSSSSKFISRECGKNVCKRLIEPRVSNSLFTVEAGKRARHCVKHVLTSKSKDGSTSRSAQPSLRTRITACSRQNNYPVPRAAGLASGAAVGWSGQIWFIPVPTRLQTDT